MQAGASDLQASFDKLRMIKLNKKRRLLPEAAGIWHGRVYVTMLVIEAAGA